MEQGFYMATSLQYAGVIKLSFTLRFYRVSQRLFARKKRHFFWWRHANTSRC